MKVYRINASFGRYSDAKLDNKSREIGSAISDNEYFKEPTPTVAELLDANSTFTEALTAAASGDRFAVAEKNKARKVLEELLLQLSGYVTMIAAGDRTILISSGFDLEKEAEEVMLVAPRSINVASGANSGEIQVKISGAKGNRSYLFEYTADPITDTSIWEIQPNTKVKHLFTGLVPGKKYWFRVAVVGKGGAKMYSAEIASFIQ